MSRADEKARLLRVPHLELKAVPKILKAHKTYAAFAEAVTVRDLAALPGMTTMKAQAAYDWICSHKEREE